ncbi:autotransporter outer membrane beta-barrel domain-containing protein [Enterobacter oligotrophicus]|uniref:autotransporter outer membrane beta-barrel domain-containing protein n=1 Tax=Enterobacter oligotrophicus TaxID=2478464 RepID=UPI00126099E4|nr:autotransporter outer membrane beta-barrel domain-containing protein [Enterobacter oligotrophicus]
MRIFKKKILSLMIMSTMCAHAYAAEIANGSTGTLTDGMAIANDNYTLSGDGRWVAANNLTLSKGITFDNVNVSAAQRILGLESSGTSLSTPSLTISNSTWTSGGTGIAVYKNNNALIRILNSSINAGGQAIYFDASNDTNFKTAMTNAVDVDNSVISGGIRVYNHVTSGVANTANVNFNNSSVLNGNMFVSKTANLSGDAVLNATFTDNSQFTGSATLDSTSTAKSALNLTLDSNSVWNVSGDSTLTNLKNQNGSVINVNDHNIVAGTLTQDAGSSSGVLKFSSLKGNVSVSGTAAGNYKLQFVDSGNEGTDGQSFVSYKTEGSTATFSGKTEQGVYQYDVATVNAGTNTNAVLKRSDRLSNSASVALGLAAAPVNIATLNGDTLDQRLNAARTSKVDQGGVWASWFGGKNKNTTNAGASYDLDTNGVMVGADTRIAAPRGGDWLAGVAFSSASSDLSTMQSKGDVDSYTVQGYLSRRFDNGAFVDTTAQFGHYSQDAKVRMLDGQTASGSNATNSFGLGMKVGYTYLDASSFFAEPYVKVSAMTFDGADYTLSNGMTVHSDDMNSVQGEVGVNLGYIHELQQKGAFVKPYFHLAGVNEFADGNTVKLNDVALDNSIDGAAVRVGAGIQVQATENLGGYAGFDYTKGSDIERPWQAAVGVNYTW